MYTHRRNFNSPPPKTIASYPSYDKAEAAVDYLSDKKFPVQYVSIVADELQFVEKVTGRLNWFKTIGGSIVSGALIGALMGFFFGLFDVMSPLLSGLYVAAYGAGFGAVVGLLIGTISYFTVRGTRDFESTSGFQAKFFDLMVDEQYVDEASKLIEERDRPGTSETKQLATTTKIRAQAAN